MNDFDADNPRLSATGDAPELSPELVRLAEHLEARGAALRRREDLVDRVHAASAEHLPAPATLPFARAERGWMWGRIALAACALLAFAVAARLLMNSSAPQGPSDRVLANAAPADVPDLEYALPTESDTVLVTLLDAGRHGRIASIDDLEGSDSVGAAFAPILGTTGVGFDDYLAEISLIEVELRR